MHVAPVLVIGLTLLAACVSYRRPANVALDLGQAVYTGDVTQGERLGSLSVYSVVASANLGLITLDGCEADVGGGVRCTFSPGCTTEYEPVLTMHMQTVAKGAYHVTAAAITGLFRTVDTPDFGPVIFVVRCGLREVMMTAPDTELGPYLASEVYSSTLVPWPYAAAPTNHADTALVMSRLAVNRGAADMAIAQLQEALGSGEDPQRVVTTAVVEAAFTLGLHVTAPNRVDPTQNAIRPVWNHDAETYPTDTAQLRRGISLLDFAMGVPHPRVNWDKIAVLGYRGHDITFTHTPSIAAMGEMNGIAHYMLGRSLLQAATQLGSCDLWTRAYGAFTTAYADLTKVPPVDEADHVDGNLVKAIKLMTQPTDSTRPRACRARA